ncbi:hypothetical protein GCM10029992_57750 [Glycomyces albus]
MSALRQSIRSLGIPHPETAIAAHSVIGSDPAVLAHAGELPQFSDGFPAWLKSTVLNGKGPLFEQYENAVSTALGKKPDEETEGLLRLLTVRPRTEPELVRITKREEVAGELERLAEAGLARTDPNPLEPELPFWTLDHRPARFYYAVMERYLPQWRRGYIADRLWGWTRARFRRYCCRPEFTALAREWALGDPAPPRPPASSSPTPSTGRCAPSNSPPGTSGADWSRSAPSAGACACANASSSGCATSSACSATRPCACTASPPRSTL